MKKSILIKFSIIFPLTCYAQITGNPQDDFGIKVLGIILAFLVLITIIISILNTIDLNKRRNRFQKENQKKEVKRNNPNRNKESQSNTAVSEESNEEKKSMDSPPMRSHNEEDNQTDDDIDDDEKQSYSSQESTPNHSSSNSLLDYSDLTVLNGILKKAEPDQIVYYRSWEKNGKLLYEFVNNERTRKAINNRSVIIEPFCIKREDSKSPDASEEIETIDPGILNEDYSIIKKAVIIYK